MTFMSKLYGIRINIRSVFRWPKEGIRACVVFVGVFFLSFWGQSIWLFTSFTNFWFFYELQFCQNLISVLLSGLAPAFQTILKRICVVGINVYSYSMVGFRINDSWDRLEKYVTWPCGKMTCFIPIFGINDLEGPQCPSVTYHFGFAFHTVLHVRGGSIGPSSRVSSC
jgi:hypothetical protein